MLALQEKRTPVTGALSALARLREQFGDPKYEPPILPRTALELYEQSRKPDTTFQDVLKLLEQDPILAARALRVAQSPLFTRGAPAKSLEQALFRLGISTLTEIFLQVSLTSKVFIAPGFNEPMIALRNHSVAAAHAARLICSHTRQPDEFAFLCGLLHDIGGALALMVLGDSNPRHLIPRFDDVKTAIADIHCEAGAIICEAWHLPPELKQVIASHHSPSEPGRPLMADVVVLADTLATEAGFPSPLAEESDADAARANLGIFDGAWRRISHEYRDIALRLG